MRLSDRYEIERSVGAGSGGGVFLVRDRLSDGARMVLKRLPAHAHAGLAQGLVNEFQIVAQLDLPTVARVFDFGLAQPDGEDPGGPFFTRVFVDGTPLDATHGQGPNASQRIVALFASAAETLHALHRLGVVHGDLKPGNLVVPNESEHVVLIDFGLAHGALGLSDRIRGGTLAFMPPERREQLIAGEALAPDPRADLYALSATLLAVLGAQSPDDDAPESVRSDPALRSLFELGRRGAASDPDRRFATANDLLAALTSGARRPRATHSRVLLRPEGRDHELGALLEHVSRRLVRRSASAPVVLLVGDEGSGRTTLLRELTWRAQLRGVQVLALQGEPGEAPLRRLRAGAEVLSGSVEASADGLPRAIRSATQISPVMVTVDDADATDPAVLDRLRALAFGADSSEPLLIVAVGPTRETLRRLGATEAVSLAGLDDAAVASLCAQVLGPLEPDIAQAVRVRTGGSPLAVTELLHALERAPSITRSGVESMELSSRARDVEERRLQSLDVGAREAVLALAALGVAADECTLFAVSARASLDAARAAGVVSLQADGRAVLVRPTLGQIALEQLAVAERADWYLRAAEALDLGAATESERATAWIRAGDVRRARSHRSAAVAELKAAGLPLAAGRLLGSLRLLEGAVSDVSEALEEAQLVADGGATRDAITLARDVLGRSSGALAQQGRRLLGRLLELGGDHAEAEAMLGEGLANAVDGDEAAVFVRELATCDLRAGRFDVLAERCEKALPATRVPENRAALLARWGLARGYRGDVEAGVVRLEEAREIYEALRSPRELARVLSYLAFAKSQLGDMVAARALQEQALEHSRTVGDVHAMAATRLNLGGTLDRTGDLGGALEHYAVAARLAEQAGDTRSSLVARLNSAGDLVHVGSYDRALSELDGVLHAARTFGLLEAEASALGIRGVVLARTGKVDEGLEQLGRARAAYGALGRRDGVAEADLDTAEVLLLRASERDLEHARDALARARGDSVHLAPDVLARTLCMEGRLATVRGDAREAQKILGTAIEQAEKSQHWEVLAQTLEARAHAFDAIGAELHARRDRERAIEVLERTAAALPAELRSAFWSVPERAALRDALEREGDDLAHGVTPRGRASVPPPGALSAVAPTIVAHDPRVGLLLELTRRLAEEQGSARVLELAVRSAVELTGAQRGAVLCRNAAGELAVVARSGANDEGPDEGFSRSIAETVVIDGEPVITHDARGDLRFSDFRSVHELSIAAVAAVPLRARGRVLGVLYVENRGRRAAWSPSDVVLMQAFAEHAALALEHANMVEDLRVRSDDLARAKEAIERLLEERTVELEATRDSLARVQATLRSPTAPAGMVGRSDAMRKVFAMMERVRDSAVPLVIEGESGTGKEQVARAIHAGGRRAGGPFVVVNSGSIPETLLESELFGHVRGAFTGADRDRRGLIASARGGTLFLDEANEMTARMQVELLRVIQDRTVRPVGSETDEQVDVRFVVASQRPLAALVREGRFREDLFYRLAVVTITLPPLRERADDIPVLATHFLARIATENRTRRKRLSREALAKLTRAPWPGNVRQLHHVLENASVLSETDTIEAGDLVLAMTSTADALSSVASPTGAVTSPLEVRRASERERILEALEQTNWNKLKAASALGIPRRTFYRRLREFGLLKDHETVPD